MKIINWDESFETGINEIDEQHRTLVKAINDFYEKLSGADMDVSLRELLETVISYTNYHFREEENYMMKIQYDKLEEQKEMHDQIRQKMISFKELFDQGKLTVSMPLTNEIKKWIKTHIIVEDKKIAEFHSAKSI